MEVDDGNTFPQDGVEAAQKPRAARPARLAGNPAQNAKLLQNAGRSA
jgi:hypothetical protein